MEYLMQLVMVGLTMVVIMICPLDWSHEIVEISKSCVFPSSLQAFCKILLFQFWHMEEIWRWVLTFEPHLGMVLYLLYQKWQSAEKRVHCYSIFSTAARACEIQPILLLVGGAQNHRSPRQWKKKPFDPPLPRPTRHDFTLDHPLPIDLATV